ncbi:MAG: ferritin-like domain-containing protein [Gaiellaceae bacterium]
MNGVEGVWEVKRQGGALPPLVGVRKRIAGKRGYTQAGPLRIGFRVDGLVLRYRPPFHALVDELTPVADGFEGRALLAGREYGRFRLVRGAGEERNMTEHLQAQLVRHIDEALAMEQSVLRMLDPVIHSIDDDEVKDALRHHKIDTEKHVDRLRERLEAHGASPSLVREAGGILGAVTKAVLDLTRAEKSARSARDAYATEHMEIAAYQLLERVAQRAGDEQTAEVARMNRSDEERMAAWLADNWDRFAELALAEAAVRP